MTLIKSISGIRGTIGGNPGEALTPLDVVKFTYAYCEKMKERRPKAEGERYKVVVGKDARLSGDMVEQLVCGTLVACGVDVVKAGFASTPTTEMAVVFENADGGIILTASHNPKQWNALKLLNEKGEFLNAEEGAAILECAEQENFTFADVDSLGDIEERDFTDEHLDAVLALPAVDVEAVRNAHFKVALDAVNSVGGIIMPRLLERLGVECVCVNCEPTGEFAHNPEPLPENLTEISEVIRREGADMGIVVDPDVDRLAFVMENGEMFVEEYTLVAVADYVLQHTKGNTVSNLSSSRALSDVTARYDGCSYAAAAVGEVNVVAKMKETGAVIGGEGNGGVIYPELHYGRDALVGVALFLTYFAGLDMTMSELRKTYPAYYASKNKIELTPEIDVDKILSTIKSRYSNERVNDIDGVKIDFAENWVHLRKSNTEPIIRIYTEAKTMAEADSLAKRFISEIEQICKA